MHRNPRGPPYRRFTDLTCTNTLDVCVPIAVLAQFELLMERLRGDPSKVILPLYRVRERGKGVRVTTSIIAHLSRKPL